MFIFYDFETSSRELLGQILTYCFIVTTQKYEIVDQLEGKIKLTRTQLPEIDALLVNRIDIQKHQQESDSEPKSAKKIYNFLLEQTEKYGYIPLTGYNSNKFDLAFLRDLLIRHGYNPYFFGRLTNLDILHYVKHLAFENSATFPYQLIEDAENNIKYYAFKLELIAKAHNILDVPQTHSAKDDVLLSIELVKHLGKKYKLPLSKFKPFQLLSTQYKHPDFELAKQKVSHYPETGEIPQKFIYKYWLKILESSKNYIVLDLFQYKNTNTIESLAYINPNKNFFILEKITSEEHNFLSDIIKQAQTDPILQNLTLDKYFELKKKDWDIEYQIHELGFKRIEALKLLAESLLQNPDKYPILLKQLLETRSEKKDNYLIQLFNRLYLNHHPQPEISHLHKYLIPRYIKGSMLKNHQTFIPLKSQYQRLTTLINNPKTPSQDLQILHSLKIYYDNFLKINHLSL